MTWRTKTRRFVRASRSDSLLGAFRRRRLLSIIFPILLLCAVGLLAMLCLELIDPEALEPESSRHAALVALLVEAFRHFNLWK